MRGQSSIIAFLLAILLIVLVLIPIYYLLLDYSKPSVKPVDFARIAKNQINGGSVLIFFNSTIPSKGNSTLLVLKSNGNFTLSGVFAMYNGTFINITKYIEAVVIKPTGVTSIGTLPQPLVYNFTFYGQVTINKNVIPLWNSSLILQIKAYNQTIFATVLPNETAFTS